MKEFVCGCLCNGRTDIRCDEAHCDLAGPGQPYGPPTQCRVCWLRLGLDQPQEIPSEPAPEYPSLFQQATNLAGAVLGHALTGFKKVTQEEKERRLSLCILCEHYDKKRDACFKCGCNLSVKTGWENQKCPIGKW